MPRHPSALALAVALLAPVGCKVETGFDTEPEPPQNSQPPEPENPIRTDRFVQATEPVVDVLFVVDNSSSMGDEQANLANNFPSFIPYFVGSGLDWHIGMVATDVQAPQFSGKLRHAFGYRYIDPETVDPAAVFIGMKDTLGTIVGSQESGRAAAYKALEERRDDPANVGFYREDAELHIVFVTDADDYSGPNPVTRGEFMQWAANLKSRPELVSMHAIVGLQPDPFCGGSARPGVSYLDYASTTGGITHSICAPDWSPALSELGLQTAGLKQEFFLTRQPVTEPELLLEIEVAERVDDGELTFQFVVCTSDQIDAGDPTCEVHYQAGRNSITFLDYTPSPLSEILVTYHIAEDFSAGIVSDAF